MVTSYSLRLDGDKFSSFFPFPFPAPKETLLTNMINLAAAL